MDRARSVRELAPALVVVALCMAVVAGLPWRCPFLALTGIPCPTCGMTRAIRLALHGDFAGATRMHPLWFVVAPTLVATGGEELAGHRREGRWGRALDRRWIRWALGALTLALIALWIARLEGAFGGLGALVVGGRPER